MAGVLLVSAGIISLAFQDRRLGFDSLPYALGTGCFIGAYSVTDGIGVRLSGTPAGYTIWMCLLWGVLMPPVYAALRGWRSLIRGPRDIGVAAGGGLLSSLAYGIIIFAVSLGPMGPVSALRKTSVVFAALIGRVFLHERLTATASLRASWSPSVRCASGMRRECDHSLRPSRPKSHQSLGDRLQRLGVRPRFADLGRLTVYSLRPASTAKPLTMTPSATLTRCTVAGDMS